jgi:hypothetical protein
MVWTVADMIGDADALEGCELCEAARFTHWYHEDDVCWVADCEVCDCPMVVWKSHGTDAPEADVAHMMAALGDAAARRFDTVPFSIDRTMRQIPTHFHAHARDRQWHQRRWTSAPSRYSGAVGGPRLLISGLPGSADQDAAADAAPGNS